MNIYYRDGCAWFDDRDLPALPSEIEALAIFTEALTDTVPLNKSMTIPAEQPFPPRTIKTKEGDYIFEWSATDCNKTPFAFYRLALHADAPKEKRV
jgi:hypothetical protein